MISRRSIEEVLNTVILEEVIGEFVQLKKSGANFKGLSPFTNEKSPSFMVSPSKQIWKDFSSGKGGNAVSFLMEHEQYSYPDAIRYLAKKYNIKLEETAISSQEKEEINEKESLFIVNGFAEKYFQQILLNDDRGRSIGYSYFKYRGLNDEIIEKFKLGYCLDDWDSFTKQALDKGYQLKFLETTGLTIVKEKKKFDRFKGRIIFPILSMSGRVLGFAGRILTDDKKSAKYLNSPESPIYNKSNILYGLYQSKLSISKNNNCYLVEGYTDVLQLFQKGITNIVASGGTALTTNQIRLIKRLTTNVTILYDGDAAGIRASFRSIDMILEQGLNVKICAFAEGEDPDSFAKKRSLKQIEAYLQENSIDFIQYKATLLFKDTENDPIKKSETISSIIISISKIPNEIKRTVYIQQCAKLLEISEDVLFNSLAQQLRTTSINERKKTYTPQFQVQKTKEKTLSKTTNFQNTLEKKIIEILVLYGTIKIEFKEQYLHIDEQGNEKLQEVIDTRKVFEKIYMDLQQDEITFADTVFKELYDTLMKLYQSNPDISQKEILNTLEEDELHLVSEIIMNAEKYPHSNWESKDVFITPKEERVNQLSQEVISDFRLLMIKNIISDFQSSLKEDKDIDIQKSRFILEQIQTYKRLANILSNLYRRRIVV